MVVRLGFPSHCGPHLGFFAMKTQFHGTKGDDFAAYVRFVLTEYDKRSKDCPHLGTAPATVIFDNLPPWSPFLNPIETVFSLHKRGIRTLHTTQLDRLLATEKAPYGLKGIRQREILEEFAKTAQEQVTVPQVSSAFVHAEHFVPRSLNLVPILGEFPE
eukprot:m.223247 g.223247  ORF g.223247 m.223247 type:complete len:159 (+) comp54185_c0_seq37:533-1009(+)